ncbi:MAG: 5'-nucleotidase C-terminal domain-containing protein [Desulfatibacillum sp.]|nr:5'-nucleotidase C-terminal domain-containing protein [Desulfatibacillum sp.]
MKKFKPTLIILSVLLLILTGGCSWNQGAAPQIAKPQVVTSLPGAEETVKIRLMHVNDIHSHLEGIPASVTIDGTKTYLTLGGMGRLAAKVKATRAICPRSMLLCAGDAVQGTLYFPTYGGKAEADFMNLLGFDAMVLGNHEFDKGPGFVTSFASLLDFPLLGANVILEGDQAHVLKPYVIREVGGESVAILGLLTPETAEISNAGPTVQFQDEQEVARRYVAELESQGINKIVVLSHLGYSRDIALAKAVSGIDVIIGGHSHTLLGDFSSLGMQAAGPYPTMAMSPENDPVYIAQAWEWAKGMGALDVLFNREGEVVKCTGNFTLLTGEPFMQKDAAGKKEEVSPAVKQDILAAIAINPEIEAVSRDPQAMALLATYSSGLEAFRQEVVAKVPSGLLQVRIPGAPHPGTGVILKNGSMVAPLVAESLYWKCRSVGLRPDLSIQNGGGVRTDIHAGTLTVADVYNLLPFGNTAVILELNGKEVRQAISKAVERALDPTKDNQGAFPYLGNARFTVDKSKAPGNRVVLLEFKNAREVWTPIQEKEVYRVVVNKYLSTGGDGYTPLGDAKGMRMDTGFVDAAVFMEYAKAHDPLTPPVSTGVTMQ